ncbi:bifunctional 5,10-methylene-tetrahydrofolate dehydrogenase/5,10-methylene-tetrahydrofolate cyclohydrolase [Deinococcus irradiatisoli]|uniref:Bifunctional protein FolD n=1 Tax=Deinococcus irradiatisoli TaxID=2202254 RepID=A0A2Z3JMK0_9DEIO|nr:tetrahydrofolate dehydrogenase/cyclohydrolase catalytic domain-containing protein [Deinococcus irradiatisoli]AWN22908.1 bifunctional 5,10-methylene-tetrahydrofolate dehydrogenase/5,10-methylene-tetrahydrofolate cyclohydrolase [Deinococcus irradiatisoli]
MSAAVLAGPPAAQALLDQARARAAQLPRRPELHVIRLGDDPASLSYVSLKEKKALEVGLGSTVHALPETTSEAELLGLIERLNADPAVSGLLVQLPLPEGIDSGRVLDAVSPDKDVDGFHPVNVGRLWSGAPALPPCTPAGVVALLDHYGLPIAGQRAVIVGRSNIVGKPLAALLLARDATVTLAHSRTPDLSDLTRQAELLVVAVGQAHLITAEMVRPGATVIDVGVNRVGLSKSGKARLAGDVHPDAAEVAAALTPVPGGVGPMTVAQLIMNTVLAAERLQAGEGPQELVAVPPL